MKVILLQDIKNFGRKFDVKQVKDGYARNFLLPRNLVKVATSEAIKQLEIQKAVWQKQEIETKNKLEALAKELTEKEFHFALKTGDKGEVFGSIDKNDIKNKLSLSDSDININLERPIKKLGTCQVEINLGKGIKTSVRIIIEPLDSAQG